MTLCVLACIINHQTILASNANVYVLFEEAEKKSERPKPANQEPQGTTGVRVILV